MKRRDILLIIIGVAVGLFAVQVYRWLMPRSDVYYYEGARLVSLNEEVSEQRSNAIVIAAQKVSPSVASITVVQTKVVSASPFFSPFADEFFRDFFGDFFPERPWKLGS